MKTSPFPGMDPFLEEPFEWSSVHSWLIAELASQLSDKMPPPYYVRIEQRVYIVPPDEGESKGLISPDIYVVQEPVATWQASITSSAIRPPTLLEPVYDLLIHDRYLEIYDQRDRQLITIIELLSPFNKTIGHEGYEAFQKKRRQVMRTQTHWLEIDLLRDGVRPVEVRGKSDYYALLKRGDRPRPYEVWFFDLPETLPTIAVPLRPPDADVPLDLQAAFNHIYHKARYGDSLDYNQPVPPPRLRPQTQQWFEECLQTWREAI